jgi:hypothetical protein
MISATSRNAARLRTFYHPSYIVIATVQPVMRNAILSSSGGLQMRAYMRRNQLSQISSASPALLISSIRRKVDSRSHRPAPSCRRQICEQLAEQKKARKQDFDGARGMSRVFHQRFFAQMGDAMNIISDFVALALALWLLARK